MVTQDVQQNEFRIKGIQTLNHMDMKKGKCITIDPQTFKIIKPKAQSYAASPRILSPLRNQNSGSCFMNSRKEADMELPASGNT